MDNHHSAPRITPPGNLAQRVLNEHWPLRDERGKHARGIQDQPKPIPVTARIVFKDDGEVFLDGMATRWHEQSVFVAIHDQRLAVHGAWVNAKDVKRR